MKHIPLGLVVATLIFISGNHATSQDLSTGAPPTVEGLPESSNESPDASTPGNEELTVLEKVITYGLSSFCCLVVLSPAILLLLIGYLKRDPERRFWARKIGWTTLAERFSTDEPCPESCIQWQTLAFGKSVIGKTGRLSLGSGICITVTPEWVDIRMGTLAKAYAAHKVFVPLRIPLEEIELIEVNTKSLRPPAVVVRILDLVFQFHGKSAQAVADQLNERSSK